MENQICSICRETGCNIITACDHYYHYHCLNRWLGIRPTCPMCREVIPSHGNLDNEDMSSADYDNSSERGVDMTLEESIDANLRILDRVVRLDISPLADVNFDDDDDELVMASELIDVAVEAAADVAAEIAYDVALEAVSGANVQEVNISRSVAIGVDNESGNMLIEVEEVEVESNYRNLLEEMNRLREQNSNLRDELYELREDRIEELREENGALRDDISEVREENTDMREENIDLRNQNEHLREEKTHLRIQVDNLQRLAQSDNNNVVSPNISDIQNVRNILNEVSVLENELRSILRGQAVSSSSQETNIVQNLQNRVRELEEKDENSFNKINELQDKISILINMNENKDERIEYLNRINDVYTGILHLQGQTKDFYKLKYRSKCTENIELMDENIQMLDTNIRLQRLNDLYRQFYNTSSQFINRMMDA
jgi:chromosome segregation ATPase